MSTMSLGTISVPEIRVLGAAVNSIDVNEREGEALHLLACNGARTWVVEGPTGQLVLHADDPDLTVEQPTWLPVSERIRRFADCFDGEPAALTLVDGMTVVAESGNVSAAIDLVRTARTTPERVELQASAQVVVPMAEFIGLLWSARNMPSGGMGDVKYPTPVMWLQLGAGSLGLHVDWSDFLPSRSTYRMKATRNEGTATVGIPHNTVENFLRQVRAFDDEEDELDLTIVVGTTMHGGEQRSAVSLDADDWHITIWLVDPLKERWASDVETAFNEAGITVLEYDEHEWLVEQPTHNVRVVLHHGTPDVARVTALLVTNVEENLELLRELSALNAASTGVRYWLEEGVVRAASDVPCTGLGALAGAVREVSRCAAAYTPMLAMLGATG